MENAFEAVFHPRGPSPTPLRFGDKYSRLNIYLAEFRRWNTLQFDADDSCSHSIMSVY